VETGLNCFSPCALPTSPGGHERHRAHSPPWRPRGRKVLPHFHLRLAMLSGEGQSVREERGEGGRREAPGRMIGVQSKRRHQSSTHYGVLRAGRQPDDGSACTCTTAVNVAFLNPASHHSSPLLPPPRGPPQVPGVLTPVQIPATESLEHVATVLIDTAGLAQEEHLVARIKVGRREGGREGGREGKRGSEARPPRLSLRLESVVRVRVGLKIDLSSHPLPCRRTRTPSSWCTPSDKRRRWTDCPPTGSPSSKRACPPPPPPRRLPPPTPSP